MRRIHSVSKTVQAELDETLLGVAELGLVKLSLSGSKSREE